MATLRRSRPLVLAEFCPGTLRSCSGIEPAQYLRLFLDERYEIAVLLRSGVPCRGESDIFGLMEKVGAEQLDLVCEPT